MLFANIEEILSRQLYLDFSFYYAQPIFTIHVSTESEK